MELEVGDIVMCTVDRIVGTIVFVKLDSGREGSIIFSEISPGRIRNIRDFVVPKKRIICKVIRITDNNIDLSLRRVTPKEQKEIKEKYKLEKSYRSILNTTLEKKSEEIINKILEEESLYDFFQEAKEDSKKLEKLVGKVNSEKILKIIETQKRKKSILKKEIGLTTTESNGLTLIKETLGKIKNAEVKYISAGKYLIKIESKEMKTANNEIKKIIENLQKESKKQNISFTIKEK